MNKPLESRKILLVDDDQALCQLLTEYLNMEGFTCTSVNDGQEAIEALQIDKPCADTASNAVGFDIVVLDVMMPIISGLEALKQIRQFSNIPIIMLTGRGDDIDRILGLEMGADDYLAKPCNPRELSARLKAILRRTQASAQTSTAPSTLASHGISLDTGKLEALFDGNPLVLTSAEFSVLKLLIESQGEVLTKEFLTEQVLQRKLTQYDRSIDVHVSRIRQKINALNGPNDIIKSIRGKGYQLINDGESNA